MRDFEILHASEPQPIEGGERCQIAVRIPKDLRFVEGHFANNPIVPGVAQLLPLVLEPARRAWPDLGPPTAIRRLKFRAALRPEEELAVVLTRQGDKVRFEIRKGETLCTRGALVFATAS